MKLDQETLSKVAEKGTNRVSQDFSKLTAGEPVKVSVSEASYVSYKDLQKNVSPGEGRSLFAYTQMIRGVDGVSILTMTREEALTFLDLLNKRTVGSTGVLMDLDRSAIKETLNILSNSFLNALDPFTDRKLIISAPTMVTGESLRDLFARLAKRGKPEEQAILFKTVLQIARHRVHVELFLIFNAELSELIESLNKK
jgi:chemotaxis protein CheY-P-specific phosphatase CheC